MKYLTEDEADELDKRNREALETFGEFYIPGGSKVVSVSGLPAIDKAAAFTVKDGTPYINNAMIKSMSLGIGGEFVVDPEMLKVHDTYDEQPVITFSDSEPKVETVEEKFDELLAEELKRYGGADASVSITAIFGRVLTEMQKLAAENGTSLTEILENEMPEEVKSAKLVALEKLAGELTELWSGDEFSIEPLTFDLTGPASLTIWREATGDKLAGYSRQSHIGGESFVPSRAYVGKKGFLILVMKPVAAETYHWAEFPLTDALLNLQGFQQHFVKSGASAKWAEVQNIEQEERKKADLAKFGASYDDFGSY